MNQTVKKWWRPWSHSRMDLFYKCPFAFSDHYRDGFMRPSGPRLRIGKNVHECIHQYTLHCQAAGREVDTGRAQSMKTGRHPQRKHA